MPSYELNHLRDWINERKCLSISCLERKSNMNKDSLRHFLKGRKSLKADGYLALTKILSEKYGYKKQSEQ